MNARAEKHLATAFVMAEIEAIERALRQQQALDPESRRYLQQRREALKQNLQAISNHP